MLVACVTGDEYATVAIAAGDHDPQIPEADVIELSVEFETSSLVEEPEKIVVVGAGPGWHRRVEKEALADIDATEKLPVAFQLWLEDAKRGASREALQRFVELPGAEHRQHHPLIE